MHCEPSEEHKQINQDGFEMSVMLIQRLMSRSFAFLKPQVEDSARRLRRPEAAQEEFQRQKHSSCPIELDLFEVLF
jgi:hypothetical protein